MFVWSRWLDIFHKHAKKELGQYLAILTSPLVNNLYYELIALELVPLRGEKHFKPHPQNRILIPHQNSQ